MTRLTTPWRRVFTAMLATTGIAVANSSVLAASAGFELVRVPSQAAAPAIDVALWYPTDVAASERAFGPFTMTVAPGAAVSGRSLPVVVVSHGTGGSSLSHHDTAVALAEAGFVVAAVEHPGDNYKDDSRAVAILDRPAHLSRTLDHLFSQWRAREQLDANRVGAFGFSAGGFTVLALAGGVAELKRVAPHCVRFPRDFACGVVAKNPALADATWDSPAELRDARVRAVVSAAPALGFTFTQASLAAIPVPVQLWRAAEDEILPHPWYAEAVRQGLPATVDYRVVEGARHFEFLAPCTEAFARMAPVICRSPAGFDRTEFHRRLNAAVVAFFKAQLRGTAPASSAAPAVTAPR